MTTYAAYAVTLPYAKSHEALAWAKKNAPSYITNTYTYEDDTFEPEVQIKFHFTEEKDAVMFTLRFK